MERLTEKYSNGYGGFEYIAHPNKEIPMQLKILKAFEKLGKLEDLEEQIGMPLDEVINLMSKKVWIINNNKIVATRFDGLDLKNNPKIFVVNYFNEQEHIYKTYEEAEKKLEEMKNEKSNCRI